MERCPNCSARVTEDPSCRRCGMDLTRLLEAEQGAERLLREAIERLLAGDLPAAHHSVRRSLVLQADPLAKQLSDFLTAEIMDRASARGQESHAKQARPQATASGFEVLP